MILDVEEKRELDQLVKDAESVQRELASHGMNYSSDASRVIQRLKVWQQTADVIQKHGEGIRRR